jgi:hypothetical protein
MLAVSSPLHSKEAWNTALDAAHIVFVVQLGEAESPKASEMAAKFFGRTASPSLAAIAAGVMSCLDAGPQAQARPSVDPQGVAGYRDAFMFLLSSMQRSRACIVSCGSRETLLLDLAPFIVEVTSQVSSSLGFSIRRAGEVDQGAEMHSEKATAILAASPCLDSMAHSANFLHLWT